VSKPHHDVETRSAVDLKKSGSYKYFESETTHVWVMSWKVGSIRGRWRPGDADPQELLDAMARGEKLGVHHAAFERACWAMIRRRWCPHWPELTPEGQDCTMSRAAALSLPQSLGQLGEALKAGIQKDDAGYRVMMQLCKPRRIEEDGTIVWWDDPVKIARQEDYCDTDVDAEESIDDRLPPLSAAERRVWLLDQHINDRGILIDLRTVERAIDVVGAATKRADREMWRLTGGAVSRCTEAAKIVAWLNDRGIPCESVAKGEIEELVIKSQIMGDDDAEAVVRLRRASAKSSTAKFKAMTNSACADGRVRGTLAYHAASTGRWGGRLVQPQNFRRIDDLDAVLLAVEVLNTGLPAEDIVDRLELLFGSALDILSQCLRAMLIAGPGNKFVGGDFSNIEGRVNAWLAGEAWKVKAFADYDAGIGADLYKLAYSRSFGVDVAAVTKSDRQIGKVMELALGYQGGVGAFQTMASGYGIAVSDERADELKTAWRDAHPNIKNSWRELEDCAVEAVMHPGVKVPCLSGRVAYKSVNGFLFCQLPSGRVIAYASPEIAWSKPKVMYEGTDREFVTKSRREVRYWGVDSTTKKWSRAALYGGLQCENIVQAVARDIMAEAMFRAEAAGYTLVLTVHDELLCEVPDSPSYSAKDLEAIMAVLPEWATGLPVAAAAWEDQRYVK